ncbi:photosynthetic complex putative assembly protein PuhB [Erythrobacter sp. YT30]|uniref:photosynthetic complex putative assembly protein PuhB n=1 Tax=Erythrobacter sp. YT30 TaxID=1735012 RepID=UPI000AE53415|nr:photosynthetic complex putative assembly protein PuhB [Erythrobacter sp. YT30]
MDLNTLPGSQADGRDLASSAGANSAAELDQHGPKAHGDPMGTPAVDERVLWKGRPDAALLARTAFHTRSVAIYFAILTALAFAFGSLERALFVAGLGAFGIGVLYLLAQISARTSLYILTDARLILRIGMAIEARINVPLKQVRAANLKTRGKGHGDIALELKGERLLGYFLLWPHVRPFRFQHPQPMLRAVPDAEAVAMKLAEARSAFGAIERNLTQVKDAPVAKPQNEPAVSGHRSPDNKTGLEGAPA